MSTSTAPRSKPKAKAAGPTTRIETITPEMAERYLDRNTHNRPIRQRRVDDLVAAIQRGEWRMNGDAIRFGTDGSLLDGQHRLWAIVLSETPCKTLVVDGLDGEAQQTMDTGARRNLTDTLRLKGYPSATRLSAALSYLWKMENGRVREGSARPSIAQALGLLEEHPALVDSGAVAQKMSTRFRCSQGQVMALHYTFASIDSSDADTFFEKLVGGVGLSEKDPIYHLRSWYERQSAAGAGARSSSVVAHALTVKAWNAWRQGMEVARLTWKAAGVGAEAIPEAI